MAVSIDRARQFYMENRDKFPGMNMTDAVASIVRSGTLPVAAAPAEEAPPAATLPVPTPTQVTPPPAPQQAPAPAPEYVNPYTLAAQQFDAANPIVPAVPAKKGPVDYAARARQIDIEDERTILRRKAAAAEGAKIDPKVEEVLTGREGRIDEELANVDKDRQQAIWMAIAQAGMKMAQSQSPYFLQALASGMEAGINGYSEEKAKAAEKKARLKAAKEDVLLSRVDLLDKARDRAVSIGREVSQDLATKQALRRGSLANLIGEATIDEQIAEPALRNQMIRENIAGARQSRGLAADAARRARAGGNSAAALGRASEWASGQAEKALEAKGIGRDDPSYGAALAREANRYRNLYFASNPVEAAKFGINPQDIKLDWGETVPANTKKKGGWLSGLFD